MSERKDKKKVVGEPMTDDQVRVFLNTLPEAGEDPDFHALLRAYRSLREDDFERFLGFFREANRNIDATDPAGRTLLEIVSGHRKSGAYAEALRAAGAH